MRISSGIVSYAEIILCLAAMLLVPRDIVLFRLGGLEHFVREIVFTLGMIFVIAAGSIQAAESDKRVTRPLRLAVELICIAGHVKMALADLPSIVSLVIALAAIGLFIVFLFDLTGWLRQRTPVK